MSAPPIGALLAMSGLSAACRRWKVGCSARWAKRGRSPPRAKASPLVALTYERELIEVKREIETLNGELSLAKNQLAALMNVRPGTKFHLAPPKRASTKLGLPNDAEQLYLLARRQPAGDAGGEL